MIKISKSCLGDLEKKAVLDVLNREFLGMGQDVLNFEKLLSAFFGRPTVCVVNGTSALHLSLLACRIGPGDEVLVPSLTYIASFQAISACGAKPVACDVNPETLTIDWKDAFTRLTPNTKAIMPMHYAGGVGHLQEVYTFARKNNLRVVEDAAHAFGTLYHGERVGSFGDIACFSFDGIKNITSGEGGCIVSNDMDVINFAKDARLLGVHKDSEKRYNGDRSWDFDVFAQGWRYHMSNIMAAIGIQQLLRFEDLAKIRQSHAKLYDKIFNGDNRIKYLPNNYCDVVPHIYVVRIPGLRNRLELQEKLLERGIQTGFHYQLNHKLSLYKSDNCSPLINCESLAHEIITLPLHPDMSEIDVTFVADNLKKLI